MEVRLDEKDIKILEELQKNCRIPARELAKKLGSPITTVYARIKRLERLGVIKGYTAALNPFKLGFHTTAFILISYSTNERKSQRDVAREIAELPEVQEVHIVTGDWDILVKVKVRDVEELGKFVVDKLRSIEGVGKTLTSVVLSTEKETAALKLNLIQREQK